MTPPDQPQATAPLLADIVRRLGRIEQLAEALAADIGGPRASVVMARRAAPGRPRAREPRAIEEATP